MSVSFLQVTQGSPEWHAARRGVLTASVADKLLTPTGRPSSSYESELGRLIAEMIGWQEPEAMVPTAWMEHGTLTEEDARLWFSVETGLQVEEVGFVMHDSCLVGCSPDGLVREGGLIYPLELKCPKPSTHVQWLLKGGLPDAHKQQMHFQIALLKADHGWFMSYCEGARPVLIRVEADEYTAAMGKRIEEYIEVFPEMFEKAVGYSYKFFTTLETE